MELKARNVNDAFSQLVRHFHGATTYNHQKTGIHSVFNNVRMVKNETRNGPVLRIDEPVMITYERPLERVLFNLARDANPFFHLYEALWMLAGRNDVDPLSYYNTKIGAYSDNGQTFNGAYGYRWRHAEVNRNSPFEEEHDQFGVLVTHLKADPTSRRAVLQMWNVEDDLLKIGANPDRSGNAYNPDLKFPASKDVCCNLSVMFSLRQGKRETTGINLTYRTWEPINYLDMTVTNRSNDMIWGMLGANYVHFTFLQEYMAARLGVEVGRYHHFTNNLHVYESNWKPVEWLAEYERMKGNHRYDGYEAEGGIQLMKMVPLVQDPVKFEKELHDFVEHHSGKFDAAQLENQWTEPFFSTVAGPMLCAFACHKEEDYHGALILCDQVEAEDWKTVATAWIRRRMNKKGVSV